ALHRQPRGTAQRPPPLRRLPPPRGPGPRRRAKTAPETLEDRPEPAIAPVHRGPAGAQMESGADLPGSAQGLPPPPGDARGPRDDLPSALRPGPRRTAPGTGPSAAYRASTAKTTPPAR